MKFTTILTTLGLCAASLASPMAEKRQSDNEANHVTVANLTFHGGPASYSMSVPSDGTMYETPDPNMAVSIIDTPTFNAYTACTFYTEGEKTIVQSITEENGQQLIVGPPQPITAVSCEGYCIYTYGLCYGYYGEDDQYYGPLGSCCAGYCAATRCRPWF